MKYRTLESFRGLAAILVAMFHSTFVVKEQYPIIAQGAVFVDFFFILSGFVMAFAYSDRIREGFSFTTFFVLRFGRLYPLHLFVLLLWVPYILARAVAYHYFGLGDDDPFVTNNIYSFVNHLFLTNGMGVQDYLSWNYPAWSISVELYTYVAFFAVIFLFRGLNDLALTLGVSVICYATLYVNNPDTLIKTYDWGYLRCMGGFFLGAAVYNLSRRSVPASGVLANSVIEILAVGLMFYLVSQVDFFTGAGLQLACFACFAMVIYIFSIQEEGVVSRLLLARPLIFLGTLSYSIYMIHSLVFMLFANVAKYLLKMPVDIQEENGGVIKLLLTPYADLINLFYLAVIVGLSYLTYRYVEVPWRDKFRALSKRRQLSFA